MTYSTAQLYLMRTLLKKGWEANEVMLVTLINRCGATREEWDALYNEGIICKRANRYWLSTIGEKQFKKAKVGRYF